MFSTVSSTLGRLFSASSRKLRIVSRASEMISGIFLMTSGPMPACTRNEGGASPARIVAPGSSRPALPDVSPTDQMLMVVSDPSRGRSSVNFASL